MNRHGRLLQTILRGRSDANIRFSDLRSLMEYLGFEVAYAEAITFSTRTVSWKSSTCRAAVATPNPTK